MYFFGYFLLCTFMVSQYEFFFLMAQQQEAVQIVIDVQTQEGIRKVAALRQEWERSKESLVGYKKQQAELVKAITDYEKAQKKVALVVAEINKLEKNRPKNLSEKSNEAYTKSIEKLQIQLVKLRAVADPKNYAKIQSQYGDIAKSIDELAPKVGSYRQSIKDQIKETGLLALTNKELAQELREVNMEYNKAEYGSKERLQLMRDSNRLTDEQSRRRKEKGGNIGIIDQIKGQLPSALIGGLAGGGVALAIAGIGALGTAISNLIPPLKELADRNSNLKIALNLSDTEVKALNADLRNIDTRTAIDKLKDLAMVGGDLNVATEDIKSFVQAGDKVGIVFERSFGQGTEAVETISKLSKEFKDTKNQKYAESLQSIGSALKVLEDDGPATAKSVAEFTARIGQMPDKLKPTITQVMALGAVFEEANLTAEISSGGMSNTLLVMAQNTDKFYNAIKAVNPAFKLTQIQFKDLVNNNPNEAFLALADSSKKLTGSGLGKWLKELNLNSQETIKVVGVTGDNIDKIRAKQELSNKSFGEASRLTEIFAEKNNNLAGQMERASKGISNWIQSTAAFGIIRDGITNMAKSIANALTTTVVSLEDLTNKFNKTKKATQSLTENIEPLLDKYDKLSKNKAPEAQKELKEVIYKIGQAMPTAITSFNEYGDAMDISTEKARKFIVQQQAMMRIMNKELITKSFIENSIANKKLKETQSQLDKYAKAKTDSKGKKFEIEYGVDDLGDSIEKKVFFEDDFVSKKKAELLALKIELNATYQAWKGFRGEFDKTVEKTKIETDTTPDGRGKGADYEGVTNNNEGKKETEQANKIAEEKLKIQGELLADIAKMNLEFYADQEDKALAKVTLDYEQDLSKNKKLLEEKKISQIQYNEWAKIRQKAYSKEIETIVTDAEKKLTEESLKIQQEAADRAYKITKDLADAKLQTAEKGENGANVYDARLELLAIEGNYELASIKNTEEEKELIRQKFREERMQAELAYFDWLGKIDKEASQKSVKAKIEAEKTARARIKNNTDKIINYAQQAGQAMFSLAKQQVSQQSAAEDKAFATKIDRLEKQKEAGVLSENEYQTQKLALETDHNKKSGELKHKQAVLDKANIIAQILLTNALNVVKAAPNPLAIAEAIAVGIAQLILASAVPIPEYAKGGWVESLNWPMKKPSQTAQLAWLNEQGQEYVVSASELQKPAVANMVGVMEGIKNKKISGDPSTDLLRISNKNQNQNTNPISLANQSNQNSNNNKELTAALVELNTQLNKGIVAKTYFGHEEAKKTDRLIKEVDQIRKRATR